VCATPVPLLVPKPLGTLQRPGLVVQNDQTGEAIERTGAVRTASSQASGNNRCLRPNVTT
jgi:hypothetical protein